MAADLNDDRLNEALNVVSRCVGENGIYASTERYSGQYWMRDFAFAGLESLLTLERPDLAKTQLLAIAKRQKRSGKIPMVFNEGGLNFSRLYKDISLTNWRRMLLKGWLFFKNVLLRKGFDLRDISSWCSDSEILFVISCLEYYKASNDSAFFAKIWPHIERAIIYVEKNLMKDGLVYGSDWRDVMFHLADKALLSNNALIYRAYILLGEYGKAERLKDRINGLFWNDSYYIDCLGSKDFDVLGQSLAIIYGIVPAWRNVRIAKKYRELDTKFGIRANNNIPDKTVAENGLHLDTNQYAVIWPFIVGYAILALLEMGEQYLAESQFEKWQNLFGFCEWYDPNNGVGLGGKEQMWSAALYLRAAIALMNQQLSQVEY